MKTLKERRIENVCYATVISCYIVARLAKEQLELIISDSSERSWMSDFLKKTALKIWKGL